MGEQRVKLASSKQQVQTFVKNLLTDFRALEQMLDEDWFEKGITRIGAEQEFCLVDRHWKPAPLNIEVMEKVKDPLLTTELAKFNMEFNMEPLEFKGTCLSEMENTMNEIYDRVTACAREFGAETIMTGILPTIRKFDVSMDNLTPYERYRALMKAIDTMRGEMLELRIRGTDELQIRHDSPLLEGCNTGFQVHLQTRPDEFVKFYNIAQCIAAPVLAISVNSPMLFGKRLWQETRIALFQQSVDTRRSSEHLREMSPRVMFGNHWLEHSILEIYREDIARFRVLLSTDLKEDVHEKLAQGITPKLNALQVHNSTVYRWNRPCYGISPNGQPHLRIENRVLPAGPTIVDEVASAAFWLGLMNGFDDAYGDFTKRLDFSEASSNFFAASRNGLNTRFNWFDETMRSVPSLIEKDLVPVAKAGLEKAGIESVDIDKYMNIICERAKRNRTGAAWMLASYSKLIKDSTREETIASMTASIVQRQKTGKPVHEWELADFDDIKDWDPASMLVEEFMTTDLFTVQKDDILEFVAEMMDWRKIRFVPVEDKKGKLIGLVTARILMRYFSKNYMKKASVKPATVKDIMINNPITIHPEANVLKTMETLESNNIGCLPVVIDGKLIGIVTAEDFLKINKSLVIRFSKMK